MVKNILMILLLVSISFACSPWPEPTAEFTGNELKYWGEKEVSVDGPISIKLPVFHLVIPVSKDQNSEYYDVIRMFSSANSELLMGQIATHSAQALSAFGAAGAIEFAIIEMQDAPLSRGDTTEMLLNSAVEVSEEASSLVEINGERAKQLALNEALSLLEEHSEVFLGKYVETPDSDNFMFILRMTKNDPDLSRIQLIGVSRVLINNRVIILKIIKDWDGPKVTAFVRERLTNWTARIIDLNN